MTRRLRLERWSPTPGIMCDPDILGGLPCPVDMLADMHAQGDTLEDLAQAYDLTPDRVALAVGQP